MNKKVLILTGGFSSEREVSLSAGKDIDKALKSKGYDTILYDLKNSWDFIEVLKKNRPDVIYNGLYGNWGEDGAIQGFLDLLQIPYTHSGMKASMLGMDKNLTKKIAKNVGIKVAESEVMTAKEFYLKGSKIKLPYVVKPVSDGSSVGVFIVENKEDIKKVKYDDDNKEILVEKYIKGKELTVMCLDDKAFVVTEMRAKNEFYDYEAKYTNGFTQHILPAELPQEITEICKKYAVKLHKALGCNCLSRIDLRWNEEDGAVLLEINTNPGMTALSLVPEQAKFAGIGYADLCEKLVENAKCRKMDK